jgi:hypothetical protein
VERASLPPGLSGFKAEAPRLDAASAVALTPDGPENARLVNAALRSSGRVAIARSALTVGGREWPAGTVFMDAAAARAARGKGVPGQAWTAVEDVPAAAEPLTAPRVGLYKPWAASMDEGWTRFLLEQYGFEPKTLDNKAVRAGALRASFDVIVLPDVPREVIASGKPKREEGEMRYFAELPPEYAGGLDKEGSGALRQFVEQGGTLVAFSAACDYVLEEFNLPVRNALARVRPDEFGVPGSLLRVEVDPSPLTYGLPATVPVFQDKAIAFDTALPGAEMDRFVLATYPAAERDILLSGWANGIDRLEKRAAAVATTFGKGRLVLLGFRPQHRAQTPATFPFVFNALYWSTAKTAPAR